MAPTGATSGTARTRAARGTNRDQTDPSRRKRDKFQTTYERAGPRFRALGMFVGFGAVEAGCKAIGQRLEQSGTHWSLPGAAAIITLRCRQASGLWEEIWQPPRNQPSVA